MELDVAEGRIVTIHCSLSLGGGELVMDTSSGEPLVYAHGSGTLVPGLERQLAGRKAGEECQIVVEPPEGYGEADSAAEGAVPISKFPPGIELRPGATFRAQHSDGETQVWVVSVEAGEVIITSNHPLAGERLHYQVRILEVQEAPADSPAPDT